MAGSIIIKPAVQQRFDSFIQRGRVLFVSAPCGFGKSTLADALLEGRSVLRLSAGAPDFSLDALPEAWDILLIDDFQQIPEGSEEQTLCQLKLSGVSVKQDGTLIYNGEEQTAAVIKAATAYGENEVKFTFSAEENGNYAATVPAFTNAGSYTVSDLFGDDQLTGTIKLAYADEDGNEIAPNMSQPGKTIIRASGLTAPNENYAVVFVDGTLTILPRSSSGGSNQGDYVIKVITGEGGSLSPSGDVGVRKGEDLTFTITPDAGYAVADVKIDGKSIGATRTKTSMRPTPSRSAS